MKYFTFAENITPEYQTCIDATMKIIPDYEVFKKCPFDIIDKYPGNLRWRYNTARFSWLEKHPNWIWLDADVVLLKPFDFKREKKVPYFPQFVGCVNINAIIGNGCSEIFKELLENMGPERGSAQRYLSKNLKRVGKIPGGYFTHKGYHLIRRNDANN